MKDWTAGTYTSDLQKTAAEIPAMMEILRLWEPGVSVPELVERVVQNGALGKVSETRTRDIVTRSFKQRFLEPTETPALHAKHALEHSASPTEMREIVFLYCLRTYLVMYDFLAERYWPAVYAGHSTIHGSEIVSFLKDKFGSPRNPDGWSDSVTDRVGRNLGNALTDFGLFEGHRRAIRRVRPYEPSDFLVVYTLLEGHENGIGDTALLEIPEWGAFGLAHYSIVNRCREIGSGGGPFLFQYSGEFAQFSWKHATVEEYLDAD